MKAVMTWCAKALGPCSATALSGPSLERSPRSRVLSGLARLSLSAAVASMLSGCLVDDPPPYPEPKQTPPRLDYTSATPPLGLILNVKTNDQIAFRVNVSSEDAGDGLNAFLLLDNKDPPDELFSRPLPPTTIDDTNRYFNVDWTVRRVVPGCHRLLLRVSHARNLPDSAATPVNIADVAEAYWWVQVDAAPSDANALVDCPNAMVTQ